LELVCVFKLKDEQPNQELTQSMFKITDVLSEVLENKFDIELTHIIGDPTGTQPIPAVSNHPLIISIKPTTSGTLQEILTLDQVDTLKQYLLPIPNEPITTHDRLGQKTELSIIYNLLFNQNPLEYLDLKMLKARYQHLTLHKRHTIEDALFILENTHNYSKVELNAVMAHAPQDAEARRNGDWITQLNKQKISV